MAIGWISTFWDNTCWTPKGHRYPIWYSQARLWCQALFTLTFHLSIIGIFLVTCNVYKQNLFLNVHLLFCRTIAPHVNKRGLLQGRKHHLWVWAFYTLNRQPSTLCHGKSKHPGIDAPQRSTVPPPASSAVTSIFWNITGRAPSQPTGIISQTNACTEALGMKKATKPSQLTKASTSSGDRKVSKPLKVLIQFILLISEFVQYWYLCSIILGQFDCHIDVRAWCKSVISCLQYKIECIKE